MSRAPRGYLVHKFGMPGCPIIIRRYMQNFIKIRFWEIWSFPKGRHRKKKEFIAAIVLRNKFRVLKSENGYKWQKWQLKLIIRKKGRQIGRCERAFAGMFWIFGRKKCFDQTWGKPFIISCWLFLNTLLIACRLSQCIRNASCKPWKPSAYRNSSFLVN